MFSCEAGEIISYSPDKHLNLTPESHNSPRDIKHKDKKETPQLGIAETEAVISKKTYLLKFMF